MTRRKRLIFWIFWNLPRLKGLNAIEPSIEAEANFNQRGIFLVNSKLDF